MKRSVSVVVPFFNRAEFLERLLDSVGVQSYKVDRVYVVDNGSRETLNKSPKSAIIRRSSTA